MWKDYACIENSSVYNRFLTSVPSEAKILWEIFDYNRNEGRPVR